MGFHCSIRDRYTHRCSLVFQIFYIPIPLVLLICFLLCIKPNCPSESKTRKKKISFRFPWTIDGRLDRNLSFSYFDIETSKVILEWKIEMELNLNWNLGSCILNLKWKITVKFFIHFLVRNWNLGSCLLNLNFKAFILVILSNLEMAIHDLTLHKFSIINNL